MSLIQKDKRSTLPEDYLETMQREFQLNDILKDSKFYGPASRARISAMYNMVHPAIGIPNMNVSYLPIDVKVGESGIPLPQAVIEELIRKSPHRIISKTCTCRHAWDCQEFDKEIGCIHIGMGTWEESDELCRHATVEEAIDHLHMAIDKGLMPFIGRVMFDHIFWDVNMAKPFVTVCMCCECCCTVFKAFRKDHLTEDARSVYHKLEGLNVHVDEDKCVGCGTCVEKCLNHCFKLENGKSVHADPDRCKGCSACTVHCPQKAVSISIDDVEGAINSLVNRIKDDVGGLPVDEYEFSF